MCKMIPIRMKKSTRQHLSVKRLMSLNSSLQMINQDEMFGADVLLSTLFLSMAN